MKDVLKPHYFDLAVPSKNYNGVSSEVEWVN